jgi:hypothetical protein
MNKVTSSEYKKFVNLAVIDRGALTSDSKCSRRGEKWSSARAEIEGERRIFDVTVCVPMKIPNLNFNRQQLQSLSRRIFTNQEIKILTYADADCH